MSQLRAIFLVVTCEAMALKSMMLVVALVLLGAAADNQTLDGCPTDCGGVPILYPFGVGNSSTTGKKCFLEESFNVTCNNSTLYQGNVPVIAINIPEGQVDMMVLVSRVCHNGSWGTNKTKSRLFTLRTPSYTISSKDNKFISVGCDTYGYLTSFYNGTEYSTGCLTKCYGNSREIVDGNCSGIGCCQVDIPPRMMNITRQAFSFENFNKSFSFNNCSYSFVVKNGNYTFSKSHLKYLPFERAPVVFDWAVGNETCEASQKRGTNACKGNSSCVSSDSGYGYQCRCNKGYEGNPYHPDGCTDIDECKTGKHSCISDHNCLNTPGSYKCFCPKGQSGNGTREERCHQKNAPYYKFVIGFIAIFVATSLLYLYHKRKLIKLKEKFFKQNGGVILLQQLSRREKSSQTAQIFTADELKKATNNYDENLIIGRGGYGIVFKGFLADNRIVAIKKSKIVDDESQIEQFINEVVVLSQINHRNVVKLLGCCLETEVPLLVYEYVNNGTLFDFIHNESKANNLIWQTRMRIATEAAKALSYLHSDASISIVHRDVKSANILLDGTYTAKVSDFGASRFVPQDQIALATMVQGTIGYLDPEYLQTCQLTEKSDVYSFGVVLVEILTGEKPLSFERSEEKKSLAIYFLSCLKEDRLFETLQVDILNKEDEQEINEVAILAAKCLRLKGEERPSMKEVAMELERIRRMQKHPWTNGDKNLEETQCLLHKASSKIYECGDSSNHQNIAYDSIKDQELSSFADGR